MTGPVAGPAAPTRLRDAVRTVLQHGVAVYRDRPASLRWLQHHLDRLDEPLRLALAGKVKAGKSTLLNALVGEAIAATDAGECTRVVTWYVDGHAPSVALHPRDGGPPRPLRINRVDGALDIDLGGVAVERVDRLVVTWPSAGLRTTTLIDTPGVASLSPDTADRADRFLTPDDAPTPADAVLYLMRHLHAGDVRFLESFHDRGVARAAPVNTVAVLSRADEIGGGRIDALLSARRIATRYRSDDTLRGLCQTVVAVAGLLAFTARTLRQDEYAALAAIAALSQDELDLLLLSADRFAHPDGPAEPPVEVRRALLDRFGMFGLRLSVSQLRGGCRDAATLADQLVARSGLVELREVLATQFTDRRDVLKARSALIALERVLTVDPLPGAAPLAAEVERLLAATHDFAELRLLSDLRWRVVKLPREQLEEAERLLGGQGASPAQRLGLEADAELPHLREAALAALRTWRRRAESPMAGRAQANAARTVVRSCEGVLAGLRSWAG
ncbi:MAG: dynamin family protein [Pseudonocardia sp.]